MFPRFKPENFDQNLKLVQAVESIAKGKGVTSGQVAIGWVLAHSGKEGLPTIIPIPGATTEARIGENTKPATLGAADLKELDDILKQFPVAGGRY